MEPLQRDLSLNELLAQLVGQIETLISAHLRLVRAEVTADGRTLVMRLSGLAVAGMLGIIGLIFLGMAALEGLTYLVAPWLAALLVALTFFGICALLAYQSLQQLKATDLTKRTQKETQETISWLKHRS